jgi:nucleotide-binding universal stress UspA family protein
VDVEQRQAEEDRAVTEQVAPWRDKYPQVAVETVAAQGSAGRVLVGASHTAQLVVVGSRGHGGLAGTLLGSVGLQLVHHADCPVFVHRG